MHATDGEPDFATTGPTTVAGRYLRRYWHPVLLSRELRSGQVRPIRVMSSDFTVYRDEAGAAHVVAARCPHRGTQLSTALVKGPDLVCHYHGWRFAPSGACLEQPAEPRPFCHKVHLATYPTREMAGLIFAYFGEPPAPPLPEWPEVGDFPYRHRIECNYFQSAENVVDDVHVPFLHQDSPLRYSTRMAIPRVSAHETDFGLTVEFRHAHSIEASHFIMPNLCYVLDRHRGGVTFHLMTAYVPIDDSSHNHFFSITTEPRIVGKAMARIAYGLDALKRDLDSWYARHIRKVLDGVHPLRAAPHSPRIQDSVMVVGQGAIADRQGEHLGQTDAAIILLRKIWRRELARFAAGEATPHYARPSKFPVRTVLMT